MKNAITSFSVFRKRLDELIACDFLTEEERITKIAELAASDEYDDDDN